MRGNAVKKKAKKSDIVGAEVWSVAVEARDIRRQLQRTTFLVLASDYWIAGRGAVRLFRNDWAADHHARATARPVTIELEGTIDVDARLMVKARKYVDGMKPRRRAHRDATGIRHALRRGVRAHKAVEQSIARRRVRKS